MKLAVYILNTTDLTYVKVVKIEELIIMYRTDKT